MTPEGRVYFLKLATGQVAQVHVIPGGGGGRDAMLHNIPVWGVCIGLVALVAIFAVDIWRVGSFVVSWMRAEL